MPIMPSLALALLAAGLRGAAAQYVGCAIVDADGHAEIPDGVTSIGAGSFRGCTSLVSVSIPSSVTSIGAESFWGCTSLVCVTVSSSVASIGANAFEGCTSLVTVAVQSSATDARSCWCPSPSEDSPPTSATAFDLRLATLCGRPDDQYGAPRDVCAICARCAEDCAVAHQSDETENRRWWYYWAATSVMLAWYYRKQFLAFVLRSKPTRPVADETVDDWPEYVRMRDAGAMPVRVITAAAFDSASSSGVPSVVVPDTAVLGTIVLNPDTAPPMSTTFSDTAPTMITVSALPVDETANSVATVCVIAASTA